MVIRSAGLKPRRRADNYKPDAAKRRTSRNRTTGPSTQSPALSLTSAGTYIEAHMDEWENTPIAMPPMTGQDGEEYARQETLDGHYETDDR